MAARVQRSAPTYFTLKSSSRSSSTTLSMGPVAVAEPPGAEPLLTRMCSPPSWLAAWATMASTCARLVTSAAGGMTRAPVSVLSSLAAASNRSLVRATMATSTPSRASSRAMALPMPRLPPVTIACLPRSPRSIADLLLPRDFERGLAQAVDGEAHAVARRRELGGDAAARHHDHVALERASAPVEQIGQPRHRLERVPHGVARLALALGAIVEPAARHHDFQIQAAPVRRRPEHH